MWGSRRAVPVQHTAAPGRHSPRNKHERQRTHGARCPAPTDNTQSGSTHLRRHVCGRATAALERRVLWAVPDGQPKVSGFDRRIKVLRAGGREQGDRGGHVGAGWERELRAGAGQQCSSRQRRRAAPPGGCAARCGEAAGGCHGRVGSAPRAPAQPCVQRIPGPAPLQTAGAGCGGLPAQRTGGSTPPAAQIPQGQPLEAAAASPAQKALALRVRYFHTDRQPTGTMLLDPGSCSGSEPPLSEAAE